MDRAISRWILIFLAQQRGINCSVFKSLLSVLPFPEDDLLLKKLDILCRILFQIDEETSITEDMLCWLEVVEELEKLMGISSMTDSLVKAYRAVAVECTARYLPGKVDKKSQYFGALERIWRGRIRLMEQTEADKRSGLLTDELILWRTRLEAALTDQSVRCELLKMNVRTDAFRLLKAYLDEEFKNLLPLLVEDPAKNVSVRGNKGGDLNISPHQRSPPRENLKRHAPYKAARVQRPRGVRIADADESETGTSVSADADAAKKKTLQATRLVNNPFSDAQGVAELPKTDNPFSNLDRNVNTVEVEERLQSSNLVKGPLSDPSKLIDSPASDKSKKSSNLEQDVNVAGEQATPQSGSVVKDPLPAANQVTEWPPSDQHEGVSDHGRDVNADEEQGVQSRYLVKNPLPDAHKETEMPASDQHNKTLNLGKDVSAAEKSLKANSVATSVSQKSKNRPCGSRELPTYNLMNRNGTAHTYEWDEPEDLLGQEKSKPNTRPVINPTRRLKRRWSPEEEATLIAGVQKFGEGQWKLILDCYSNNFEGRTSKDLKDKWRNLLRHTLPKI